MDDDFIHTIDDDEPVPFEEEALDEQFADTRPSKKAKTASSSSSSTKNKKKGNNKKNKKDEAENENEEEGPSGVWGEKDADDGAMDSEFEFAVDGMNAVEAEFDGWGFEGAKKGMAPSSTNAEDGNNKEIEDEEESEEDDVDGEVDLDEEVLADDGFGMGVGSDAEDEEMDDGEEDGEEEQEEGESGDEAASDDDSVATPVQHPDDEAPDSEDDDEDEDAEEAAKRKEFFAAPEETDKPGKKGDLSSFQSMSLSRPILRGLTSVGFTKPTPIQAKTIPIALMGKDVVGGAVTGSGKTAAFVVPILERLLYRPKKVPTTRVVILTPTRELAIQCHAVATKLASHTDIKFCLAVGGLSLKVQEAELRLRPDVVIATPGRFIDHMRNSASFAVETVEILVLDEADRMLEDGFADELNEILTTLPKSRQTMLFSATMTSSVDRLIRVGLNKPARIMVDSQRKTAGTLSQEFVRLRPGREEKRMGVEDFRDGKVNYLLATDLASRGLDIKGVDTVINYEAPQSHEIYVHRVGRTARAGRSGVAVTLAAEPDRKVVKAAVKAGKAQGAKIISRVIDPADADKWQAQVDEMEDEIEEVLREEKEEKQLAQVEMQVKKGENMIMHEEEIKSRPKRTWFETEKDKKKAKEAGRAELNGVREAMKKKGEGKLSNKDKKRLDSKAERSEGKSWKKGRAERDGKGAVLNLKKRLARFRLDTLPRYKLGLQSRIYRFIVERQRRRRDKTRVEPSASSHEQHEKEREERRIAREAREIEKRGQDEKEVANRGGYSEGPNDSKGEATHSAVSPPPSPTLTARTPSMSAADMSEAELAVANANLMARLGPFMTTPLVQIPITIFFYNDEQSRSHTVMTDDSGHFSARVALEFVPTDVRVLANENVSATRPVEIIESRGVSLISDVDDTIKRSNIWMGAREIFRNTFVRELAELTVDGVREWYHRMHEMGVKVHYCSNSPWQLFPVLATYFHLAGLPQGSIHLKQYSGMLQGIFEPVAERKKGTLEAIIRDFPDRKFLLVGDSGEADLEVYTELALANPGRVLAVFIRDVTTPDHAGFFDSSFSVDPAQRSRQDSTRGRPEDHPAGDNLTDVRPPLPRRATASAPTTGPVMGTLIDFDDEPVQLSSAETRNHLSGEPNSQPGSKPGTPSSFAESVSKKPPPPPRPAKPAALRSTPSEANLRSQRSQSPLVRPRTAGGGGPSATTGSNNNHPNKPIPPPPPPPRRRGTAPASRQPAISASNAGLDVTTDIEPLPSVVAGTYPASLADTVAAPNNGAAMGATYNKKVDLWLRRLARAHDILDAQGVKLYTWRRGEDVIAEAEGIVRAALREMK
ncbi:uncharacterized protein B0T15DRAFT_487650 [Chaetomium strumarium]|uniref:ATP-dependent RNA helicase-like protein n=1 Tax=Chaetomium strumarium TaxID=1170767 RepID=A0AAJ0GMA4_9PEZI|nr:hypothetical protein B0T15DRAFT_487650 [Chaetomium strumarium]